MYLNFNVPENELRQKLSEVKRETLEAEVFNNHYNNFCREWADTSVEFTEGIENGKRIPYMGWFWRNVNFYGRSIPIGSDGSYIGVMENNKWGYDQRDLTPEEYDVFMSHLDSATAESRRGGLASEINKNVKDKLTTLREWMQTLKI